jgi:hypothetical protein
MVNAFISPLLLSQANRVTEAGYLRRIVVVAS